MIVSQLGKVGEGDRKSNALWLFWRSEKHILTGVQAILLLIHTGKDNHNILYVGYGVKAFRDEKEMVD